MRWLFRNLNVKSLPEINLQLSRGFSLTAFMQDIQKFGSVSRNNYIQYKTS